MQIIRSHISMNLSEFQQKTSSSQKPIVIDFWAPWCAPCRATKPVLDHLAREFNEKVEFLPINADKSPEVLQLLKIYGIPTVITYRDGKEVGRVVGAQTEPNFRNMFETLSSGREVKVPLPSFDRMLRLWRGCVVHNDWFINIQLACWRMAPSLPSWVSMRPFMRLINAAAFCHSWAIIAAIIMFHL